MIAFLLGTGLTISAIKASWLEENGPGILLGFIIFGLIVLAFVLYKYLKKMKFEKELIMRAEIAGEYEQMKKALINEKRRKTIESRKTGKPLAAEKAVESIDKMAEKHLKEDEKQIVNILKEREGNCEQGTLRVVSGFPKSTLSRILKELEERNIIHKEKRGKKNMVFLRQ